jgi:protein TonB
MNPQQIAEAQRLARELNLGSAQIAGDGSYVIGGGVIPPVVLFNPVPHYTESARASRTQGIVLLQCVIRKDGTVNSFEILRGLGKGLDQSAINTIATKWRFKPGSFQGEPVDVQILIETSFRWY